MHTPDTLRSLTDNELFGRLGELVRQSRGVEAEIVAHLGEADARRLYLREAAPSMFVYATRVLHLSEAEAYLRITVARAAREHPALLARLASGELHLSGAALLAPHLTVVNREMLLARAARKSKRQIEELLAELAPRPEVPASIRKLPEARGSLQGGQAEAATRELRPDGAGAQAVQAPAPETGTSAAAGEWTGAVQQGHRGRSSDVLLPLARDRYRVQFTASEALRDKLERLQALLPGADLATLIEQAVTEKLERLEPGDSERRRLREKPWPRPTRRAGHAPSRHR
jgi:hypothetical protein